MRSFKILFFALLLFVINEVKADNPKILVDCKNNEVEVNNQLTCDISLEYLNTIISTIEFNYQSNFDLSFNASSSFTLESANDKVIISPNSNLDDGGSIKIFSMNIKTNDKTNIGNNDIVFSNIIIKDTDGITSEIENTSKTINVLEEVPKESDCTLLSITVDGVAISDFDPLKERYEPIYVSKMVVFIDAVKSSKKASISGLGNVLVRENTTVERKIHVKASDGTEKDYVLVITNSKEHNDDNVLLPDTLESDNSIKLLEIFNGTNKLDFKFESSKTIYGISINDENINKLKINATLNSEKATFIEGFGPREVNLSYGDTIVEMKVKAENEDIKIYKLIITKEKILSDENHLKSLSINGNNIGLIDNQFEYSIDLDSSVLKTQIELETMDKNAKVEFSDITLVDGINEPIIIKVTSESLKVLEYKIIVNRLPVEVEKISLKNISIIGYNFKFDSSVYNYELTINNDSELNIALEPYNIQNEIIGNNDLHDGSKVTIRITSGEETRDYVIQIHKKAKTSYEFIYYIFFGFSVIVLITSIIYAIKKTKVS